jgi:HAD superfamily hydrolase (TIGR01509 family)
MVIDLVIFDCDGVLVDSEPIAIRVLVDAIRAAGGTIDTDTAYERFLGRNHAHAATVLRDEFGLTYAEEQRAAEQRALFAILQRELLPIAGVHDMLASMTLPRWVASSSSMERIRLSLDLTGLAPFFGSNVYSSALVARGKPAPDVFLYAAARMGIAPDRTLVIEDSLAGIEAAKAAGMHVFGFAGGGHASRPGYRTGLLAAAPTLVFDDMKQLTSLLETSIRRDE